MRRLLHQRFRKRGLPPGALVQPQKEKGEETLPTITLIDYLEDRLDEKVIEDIEELQSYKSSPNPTWIDISGDHPIPTLQRLGEIFGIHALTLEDIVNKDQRPKVEEFDNYMYIVLNKPTPVGGQFEQVSVILTKRVVVSIHERVPGPFSAIRARMHHERARIRRLGTDYLAYVVIDSIVDDYFFALEQYEDRMAELDREISHNSNSHAIDDLHNVRQEIILLRKAIWPLREVIAALSKTESPLFDEGIKVYLKDLQDHIFQIAELVELFREMAKGMLDIYLSTMSHKMNEVMKTLTMIASIFIPLTLVTGCYGMNFVDMPELHWAFGYPLAIGVMVAIAIGMLAYFRRRGWF